MMEKQEHEKRERFDVLLVDDDPNFRFAMRKALGRFGYRVREAEHGEDAIRALRVDPPSAMLLDLNMPRMDGLTVLRKQGLSSRTHRVPTIVLTGHGSVEAAVEAMKLGAFSFLEKPVDAGVLQPLLAQAIASRHGDAQGPPRLIGESSTIEEVRAFIAKVGPTDETVAIYGETGSGKEVVARHLHVSSRRADKPFVALNAACVPRALFESELFGHTKGAFTGATTTSSGLFGEAEGGTLFIDEVGELPKESQAKLLRALEERKVRAVGATKESSVDVRMIVATNRNLWAEVQAGRFREDLYFRLQVFPVTVPPLRDRPDDIPVLSHHLLQRIGTSIALSPGAVDVLRVHTWRGNVRELLNVLRRAALFAGEGTIGAALAEKMVAASIFATQPLATPSTAASTAASAVPSTAPSTMASARPSQVPASTSDVEVGQTLAEVERVHIQRVLEQNDGNVTKAAQVLGIDRRTLQRKLRSLVK